MAEILGAKPSLRGQTQERFPVKAGVQELNTNVSLTSWIPAFAGMTDFSDSARFSSAR
jgi:hypothetical protein